MNLPYYIATRITGNRKRSFSRFIIRLATVATALSVAVMIMAVAIVLGFKETIKDKMFVFWGQLIVAPFNPNPSSIVTPYPVDKQDSLQQLMRAWPGVNAVHAFAVKPAILAVEGTMAGIKMKGIEPDYPLESNAAIRFSGNDPGFSDTAYGKGLIVSSGILHTLNKKIGDSLLAYFVDPEQGHPRIRKLAITGSFHTGMEEIDDQFALCDIRLLRRVSNWEPEAIHGYQVAVDDYRQATAIGDALYQEYLEPPLTRSTMNEIYGNIFSWLELMNTNTYIILIIMGIVAFINLSTALLIFIMERTHMIGVLKTLGLNGSSLQLIFMYHAASVAIRGILSGILLGVGLCLLQQYTHFIALDEHAYYMQYVPIQLEAWHVLLIGLGTLICCLLVMLLPSLMVRRIAIVKALRFK